MKWVYETVATKTPLQIQFPFALWTAAMVRQLIRSQFSVKLSHSSVCRLLNQLGLSARRPLWRIRDRLRDPCDALVDPLQHKGSG